MTIQIALTVFLVNKFYYVIGIVDEFSKYVCVKAVKSTETRHVLIMLNERVNIVFWAAASNSQ